MNKLIYTNGDNFYVFKGISYDKHFPIEWAMNPKKIDNDFQCGPPDCLNCLDYGSYNGVFIGYCANCAGEYDYQRGNGFIDYGEEFKDEGFYDENSVWNTYLKYVNLDEIGFLPKEEEVEGFQMNGREEEQEDEDEIDCLNEYENEDEDEDENFEPIYKYDEEYFEEGPHPLTMEDLVLEKEKNVNYCLIN
jgi:hypothetical protein